MAILDRPPDIHVARLIYRSGPRGFSANGGPQAHVRGHGSRRRPLALNDGTDIERLQLLALLIFREKLDRDGATEACM